MFQLFITHKPGLLITNYREAAMHSDGDIFRRWQHALQKNGVYVHPSQFECFFISTVHTEKDIDKALERAEKATRQLKSKM